MELHISKDSGALSTYVAKWMVTYIRDVLSKKNRFTLALSGGSTPKQLYQLLAAAPYKNEISWEDIHVFWGDERFVPFADERNNAKMAFDELLSHVPVHKENIHLISTEGTDPASSARQYEQQLHNYFSRQLYSFDLVLLGLGDNSHTLSLFPGYDDIIFEQEQWVSAFYLEEQQMHRITLTAPVVNNAASIVFLVSGSGKAAAVQHIIAGEQDPSLFPAQIIQPVNGELHWMLDEAAAAAL